MRQVTDVQKCLRKARAEGSGDLEKLEIQRWRKCGAWRINMYIILLHPLRHLVARRYSFNLVTKYKHILPTTLSGSIETPVLHPHQNVLSHLRQRARSWTETQRSRALLSSNQYDWKQQIKNAFDNVDRVLQTAGFRGWKDVSVDENPVTT